MCGVGRAVYVKLECAASRAEVREEAVMLSGGGVAAQSCVIRVLETTTLTPVEAEQCAPTPESVTYRQRGSVEPRIKMHRRCVRGDPRLA